MRTRTNSRSSNDGAKSPPRSAAAFVPARLSLAGLRRAATACTGCDLYRNATQTVFGEGARAAPLVLVGEQPGDREDREGHPFIGPAGRLLERALAHAGISRDSVYITNAVKHFKWVARGKRRLHQRPREGEIDACTPWLVAELTVVRPRVVVCLGSTAARAVLGRNVRIKDYRGRFAQGRIAECVFVTIHPSAILRLIDREGRQAEYDRFVRDLATVRERITDERHST
jgi:DNA polymerase